MKAYKNRRGSALIVTLIFATVALLILVSQSRSVMYEYKNTMTYGLGQCAFHLSESGVERAMNAISTSRLGSNGWDSSGASAWAQSFSENLYKGYAATTDVDISLENSVYTITALTGVKVDGRLVQSAVEVRLKAVRSVAEEQEKVGSGLFSYGLVARNNIKLNHNNPGMKIASYNSDTDFGVPRFGINTGYSVVVASIAKYDNAISINNAYIHGSVRSGGGNISYTSSHQHDPGQNATVIGPDSGSDYGVDSNRISNDFDAEIPDPEIPETTGYAITSRDQNYWQNNPDIELGSWNQPTWVNTERINSNKNSRLTIIGDVVIDAQRNLNLGAEIEIKPGATLVIMAGENIHIDADYVDQQYPSQFKIIAKNQQDVVINDFDVFTGIVDAPRSTVRLAGVGGTPKSQYRGAVVANNIEVTNGVEYYYDVNLGNVEQDGHEDSDFTSGAGELSLLSWREIPPSALQ